MYAVQRFGDTIVTREFRIDAGDRQRMYFHFYDPAFTLISTVKPIDSCQMQWQSPRFWPVTNDYDCLAAPGGLFVSVFLGVRADDSAMLVFTDRRGTFLARIAVPARWNFSFDGRGNLYFVSYTYTEADEMSENPVKTLYIYTLLPILKGMVP
jgi:hypothetical protein